MGADAPRLGVGDFALGGLGLRSGRTRYFDFRRATDGRPFRVVVGEGATAAPALAPCAPQAPNRAASPALSL